MNVFQIIREVETVLKKMIVYEIEERGLFRK